MADTKVLYSNTAPSVGIHIALLGDRYHVSLRNQHGENEQFFSPSMEEALQQILLSTVTARITGARDGHR